MFGRKGKSYCEEVRRFCLTIHFYSPRAYSYIREKFNNTIPCESTIRNWYSSINGSPGITNESLDVLHKKVEESNSEGKQVYGCLMFDEMNFRQQSLWNTNSKQYEGFIDMGSYYADDQQPVLPLATQILVYMVTGINENFKIPVAYFLINGLKTHEKAALTNEVLTRISATGIKLIAMTFDGYSTNVSMCRYLGADFDNYQAFIRDPVDTNRKIYILLDASHMLKLARNCFASKKHVLFDADNRKIDFRFIELLHETQQKIEWNLANKITKVHLQWYNKKMNVKIAAQTLSESVANCLEFLKTHDECFQDVDGTVLYIRTMNNIFDVMNSTKADGAKGYKRSLTKTTHSDFVNMFHFAKEYIKGLKVEIRGVLKPILASRVRTAYFGFYHNMVNFMKLYDEYVDSDLIDGLITHRFSQDQLETYFGCLRSMNGRNDNPNPSQIEASYRKLLIHNDVVCSKFANCIDSGTEILTVSSCRDKNKIDNANNNNEEELMLHTLNIDFDQQSCDENGNTTEKLKYHSVVYIASKIEEKIFKSKGTRKLIKCEQCLEVFVENEIMQDDFIWAISTDSSVLQPCKSTYEICKFIDQIVAYSIDKSLS